MEVPMAKRFKEGDIRTYELATDKELVDERERLQSEVNEASISFGDIAGSILSKGIIYGVTVGSVGLTAMAIMANMNGKANGLQKLFKMPHASGPGEYGRNVLKNSIRGAFGEVEQRLDKLGKLDVSENALSRIAEHLDTFVGHSTKKLEHFEKILADFKEYEGIRTLEKEVLAEVEKLSELKQSDLNAKHSDETIKKIKELTEKTQKFMEEHGAEIETKMQKIVQDHPDSIEAKLLKGDAQSTNQIFDDLTDEIRSRKRWVTYGLGAALPATLVTIPPVLGDMKQKREVEPVRNASRLSHVERLQAQRESGISDQEVEGPTPT
jgi:hypothetical protein